MVHKTKSGQLSKKQLESLEEIINKELNDEIRFGVMIENLEQYSNGKFEFMITNESGEGLNLEERKALDNVLKRNLGKDYTAMGTTFFPIIGRPHY